MSQRLAEEMSTWFAEHPGGQMTICRDDLSFSTTDATNHFRLALRSTRWEGKVKGFHLLRHSFASNAAAAGVDPGMIDSWMGHQTEEMRNRYRHLFPKQQQTAIDLLFGGRS
jgi:integrase